MEEYFGHTKNKLSLEERRSALEQLVQADLVFLDTNTTDEQKEFARVAREQSCRLLYGKSYDEAKEDVSRDLKDKLPK